MSVVSGLTRWSRTRPLLALELATVAAAIGLIASTVSLVTSTPYDSMRTGARAIEAYGARTLGVRADVVHNAGDGFWGFGRYLSEAPARLAGRASLWTGRCAEIPAGAGTRRYARPGPRDWTSFVEVQPFEAFRVLEVSTEGAVAVVLDGYQAGTRVALDDGRNLQPCSAARDARRALVARLNALPVETPAL